MFDVNTISESFVLPSRGKLNNIDPHIVLRSMTTNEEKRRLSNSSEANKVMSTIINDCIIDRKFDSYDLCVEDFTFLIYMLRVVTYGPDYPITVLCKNCFESNSFEVNLEELEIVTLDDFDFESKLTVELPTSKNKVRLRFQTPRDIDDINIRAKELSAKSKNKNVNWSYILNLVNRIEYINGERTVDGLVQKFVEDLPMRDTKVLEKAIRNLRWGLVTTGLTHVCRECGKAFDYDMPLNRDFFDPQYL